MIKVVRTVDEMAECAQGWSFHKDTALVPTMGALHEGHLTLVREARLRAERVIVSIFVNPLQFGPTEDFDKYPRAWERDLELLEQAGADVVFAPGAEDFTPDNLVFSVDPGKLADRLCGQYRPGHFTGVTTIVMKLLQATRPGMAFFGWKDAQQFLILRRMVADLNVPVVMHGVETIREVDGLAMSSRNSYLMAEERAAAPVIFKALSGVREGFERGVTDTGVLLEGLWAGIAASPLLRLQYAEAVDMDTLEAVDKVVPGNTLVAVAAFAGDTRLIDNVRL